MSRYLQFLRDLDVDTLPGKVSERYGFSYISDYEPPACITRVYIQTWGVPMLYPSYAHATAARDAFAASLTNPKYHSFRVISARKAWELVANCVEVYVGRRSDGTPGSLPNPKRPTHREQLMMQAGLTLGREIELPPPPPKFTDKPVPVQVKLKKRIPDKV